MMNLKVKKLHEDARIPKYQTEGSAGFDIHALYDTYVPKEKVIAVSTGIAVAVPAGYELQIRMRSGMAMNFPNYIANSPGTIDSDYRGEIKVLMSNRLGHNLEIKAGDRIAQGVIAPIKQVTLIEVDGELDDTERGDRGFGSTGG